MSPSKVRLGKRIRRLRVQKGLTQPALAELLGVVPSSVCDWERGVTAPTYDRLTKLAEELGVDLSALVGTG